MNVEGYFERTGLTIRFSFSFCFIPLVRLFQCDQNLLDCFWFFLKRYSSPITDKERQHLRLNDRHWLSEGSAAGYSLWRSSSASCIQDEVWLEFYNGSSPKVVKTCVFSTYKTCVFLCNLINYNGRKSMAEIWHELCTWRGYFQHLGEQCKHHVDARPLSAEPGIRFFHYTYSYTNKNYLHTVFT